MDSEKIKIGITQGDLNGIGLELVLKTFSNAGMLDYVRRSCMLLQKLQLIIGKLFPLKQISIL